MSKRRSSCRGAPLFLAGLRLWLFWVALFAAKARYSYVRNNALKYIDPSGHTECIVGDCTETSPQHDPYAFATLYGITFAGSWTPESRSAVMSAARTVDQRLRKGIMTIRANAFGYGEAPRGMVYNPQSSQLGALSSGEPQDGAAFRAVYGQITFRQVPAGDVDGWAWTRVATMGEIWVDAVGDPQYQQLGGQNTAHELGHALAQLLGGRPYDDLNATMIVDALGNDVAGGSGGTYIRTNNGYVLTNGSTWSWQQNTDATANEDFADMFLNWSYNSFDNDPAGAGDARYQWMSANMPSWIELAVTGPMC